MIAEKVKASLESAWINTKSLWMDETSKRFYQSTFLPLLNNIDLINQNHIQLVNESEHILNELKKY